MFYLKPSGHSHLCPLSMAPCTSVNSNATQLPPFSHSLRSIPIPPDSFTFSELDFTGYELGEQFHEDDENAREVWHQSKMDPGHQRWYHQGLAAPRPYHQGRSPKCSCRCGVSAVRRGNGCGGLPSRSGRLTGRGLRHCSTLNPAFKRICFAS